MAVIELGMVTGAIIEMGVEAAWEMRKRNEAVIKLLKRFNLDPNEPPADKFEDIYAYTLVEYGVFKPEPILNFFRNEFVRKAFGESFSKNDPSILEKEAEGIIQWNEETGKLGRIDYDPRREFAAFTFVFNAIVDRARTPTQVKTDRKLDSIYGEFQKKTEGIIELLFKLPTLDDIRTALDHQARDHSETARLASYISHYGKPDLVQASSDALFDSQIKNISTSLAHFISNSIRGTVLDIGCGEGIILRRLVEIDTFKNNTQWIYIGVDFEENINKVHILGRDLRMNRRVDVIDLENDNFYSSWVESKDAPRPLLIIIRNVFHELDIDQTTHLMYALASRLEPSDNILIQDLQVLPRAERGNACWHPDYFVNMLDECGFIINTLVCEPTAKGNRWFTVIAKRKTEGHFSEADVRRIVIEQRQNQLEFWRREGSIVAGDLEARGLNIALIDFDLQRTALQNQLLAVEARGVQTPTSEEQAKTVNAVFVKHLSTFDTDAFSRSIRLVDPYPHFRDRRNSQDALEAFLRSHNSTVIILGGPFMGKTVLVAEVLHHRAHSRQAILLDTQFTSSIWNLVEQYLGAIGCKFPYDIISTFKSTNFGDIKVSLQGIVEQISPYTIVCFDHFERLLDPNGVVLDNEIQNFLSILAGASSSKIIITSRQEPNLNFLPASILIDKEQPPVGRFPKGKHVENVLDDFIDRTKLNIVEYPEQLLEAIDRVPHLTVLAANVIKQEGLKSLTDPSFIEILRERLRGELLQRVVNDVALPVVEVIALLRIPVPRSMLEAIAGDWSVKAAEDLGLLYPAFDRSRSDLLTGLSVLRGYIDYADYPATGEDSSSERVAQLNDRHKRIAAWYARLYRESPDPRWVRELHYHTLASGDTEQIEQFGMAYKGELFAAGEYWFSVRKDYRSALAAFTAVASLGSRTYHLRMRLASCQMRVGNVSEGEAAYTKLLKDYQFAKGLKTSYIDSLLFLEDYQRALDALVAFEMSMEDDAWVAQEYGRAYYGLHQYRKAAAAFEVQARLSREPIVYIRLAQSYHRIGDRSNVTRVLNEGRRRHRNNKFLKLRYAAHLIQIRTPATKQEAGVILWEMHQSKPEDGGVLHQLCKLLCSDGRVEDALGLFENQELNIYPESYIIPIRVEILIGQQRWNDAIVALGKTPPDDEHLVGLRKKVFLHWARVEENAEKRCLIAKQGLEVPFDQDLLNNIPIVVTSARLAAIAGDDRNYEVFLDRVEQLNPSIAGMLRSEAEGIDYWEEDSFATYSS